MKNLTAFRIPLAIAGLFAFGFLLIFIGLFVEDPKPEFPRMPEFNLNDEPEMPKIPRFGEGPDR